MIDHCQSILPIRAHKQQYEEEKSMNTLRASKMREEGFGSNADLLGISLFPNWDFFFKLKILVFFKLRKFQVEFVLIFYKENSSIVVPAVSVTETEMYVWNAW